MSKDTPPKDLKDRPRKGGKPAHRRFANRVPKPPAPGVREDGNHVLYGAHTVLEALKNPARRFVRLVTTENGAMRLREDGPLPIEPAIVKAEDINRQLPRDAVHQGVLLIAEPLEPLSLADAPGDGLILALDQVTDPHNVGAVLRSACAFGAAGMIVTTRNSPEVTGVLAKAASGALEHVPFIEVRNLAKALAELGERGFLCVGLDSEADTPLSDVAIRRPLCLVLGAEGKGLRPVTREQCDVLAKLPMPGAIASLNVSNAAAVALYAVTTAR
jgi:23S rRNA (guanosine2251-2'-O)-methyltransferase